MGFTQEFLADGICSIAYISKIENGAINPTNEMLSLLCKRLNLKIEDLEENHTDNLLNKLLEIYNSINSESINDEIWFSIREFQSRLSNNVNPEVQLGFKIVLAHYHIYRGNEKQAISHLEYVTQNKKYLNNQLKFCYHNSFGLYEYLFGLSEFSLSHFEKALSLMDVNDEHVPDLLYNLGLVNAKLMQFKESLEYTQDALNFYNDQLNFSKMLNCTLLLGTNYSKLLKYDLAEEQFIKVINISNPKDDKKILAQANHDLGYLYLLKKEHSTAIHYLKISLNLKDDPIGKIISYYILAYAYEKIDRKYSLDLLNKGINCCLEINNQYYLFKLQILKYKFFKHISPDQFLDSLENEILPFYAKKDLHLFYEILLILAQLYKEKKHYKKSTLIYEQYLKNNKVLNSNEVL